MPRKIAKELKVGILRKYERHPKDFFSFSRPLLLRYIPRLNFLMLNAIYGTNKEGTKYLIKAFLENGKILGGTKS